jgi:hypothetical protein
MGSNDLEFVVVFNVIMKTVSLPRASICTTTSQRLFGNRSLCPSTTPHVDGGASPPPLSVSVRSLGRFQCPLRRCCWRIEVGGDIKAESIGRIPAAVADVLEDSGNLVTRRPSTSSKLMLPRITFGQFSQAGAL